MNFATKIICGVQIFGLDAFLLNVSQQRCFGSRTLSTNNYILIRQNDISSRHLYPADYRVVLSNWGYSRNIMSNLIEIQSAKEVRAPVMGDHTIDLIESIPENLAENSYFSIKLKSKDTTGRIIIPDDGFTAIGMIYKKSSTIFMESFWGDYSLVDDIWSISGQLNIPKGDYEIGINCKPSKYGSLWECKETIR